MVKISFGRLNQIHLLEDGVVSPAEVAKCGRDNATTTTSTLLFALTCPCRLSES